MPLNKSTQYSLDTTIMKKTFAILFFLSVFCLSSHAKLGIINKDGTTAFMRETNATATLSIDFSQAIWEKDLNFKDYCKTENLNPDELMQSSEKGFTAALNEKTNGLRISNDNNATYHILVRIKALEQHTGYSTWGRMYLQMWGELEVQNAQGERIYLGEIKCIKGGEDYVTTDRYEKAFIELAQELIRVTKK